MSRYRARGRHLLTRCYCCLPRCPARCPRFAVCNCVLPSTHMCSCPQCGATIHMKPVFCRACSRRAGSGAPRCARTCVQQGSSDPGRCLEHSIFWWLRFKRWRDALTLASMIPSLFASATPLLVTQWYSSTCSFRLCGAASSAANLAAASAPQLTATSSAVQFILTMSATVT